MFGGCGMIVLLVYWETTWILQIWPLRSCTREPKGTWRNFLEWLRGFGTIETMCFTRQMEPRKLTFGGLLFVWLKTSKKQMGWILNTRWTRRIIGNLLLWASISLMWMVLSLGQWTLRKWNYSSREWLQIFCSHVYAPPRKIFCRGNQGNCSGAGMCVGKKAWPRKSYHRERLSPYYPSCWNKCC